MPRQNRNDSTVTNPRQTKRPHRASACALHHSIQTAELDTHYDDRTNGRLLAGACGQPPHVPSLIGRVYKCRPEGAASPFDFGLLKTVSPAVLNIMTTGI